MAHGLTFNPETPDANNRPTCPRSGAVNSLECYQRLDDTKITSGWAPKLFHATKYTHLIVLLVALAIMCQKKNKLNLPLKLMTCPSNEGYACVRQPQAAGPSSPSA